MNLPTTTPSTTTAAHGDEDTTSGATSPRMAPVFATYHVASADEDEELHAADWDASFAATPDQIYNNEHDEDSQPQPLLPGDALRDTGGVFPFTPATAFRDAAHAFIPRDGPCDLMFQSDSFPGTLLTTNDKSTQATTATVTATVMTPVFVHDAALLPRASKLNAVMSPMSPSSQLQVPKKSQDDFFLNVNASFTSHAVPTTILRVLQDALVAMDCEVDAQSEPFVLHARCLVVAEEFAFSASLYELPQTSEQMQYEVEFDLRAGDELRFSLLIDAVRARCAEVDDDASVMAFLNDTTADAWMVSSVPLEGRRHAISERKARELLNELNCQHLHADTLYEIAKEFKDLCRHRGNRQLLLATGRQSLVQALTWMLSDVEEMARFALFVLLQYAQDQEGNDSEASARFFETAYEKSTFTLRLDELTTREPNSRTCAKFTNSMVENVRQSALFV